MRVQAGIALLATMLEPASLDRALAQNPAAAAALAIGALPRATCGWRNPICVSGATPRRRRERATTPRSPRGWAPHSTSTGHAGCAHRRARCGSPRGRAWRFSAPTSSATGSQVRRSGRWRARACCARFDVQIGVRDATASIDAPCPVRRLSQAVVREILAGSDAIVLQGPVSDWYPEILASDVPIAVDLYDPMNLEALESRHADELVPYTTQLLRAQVARGDFFFCASERQRDYWIGMLAGAGRVTSAAYRADPDLRQLVDVVPFGIPGEPPRRTAPGVRGVVEGIGEDDPLFIWNGGLWGWFEPELFIRAIDIARRAGAERPGLLHGRARSSRRRALARGARAPSRWRSGSGCATRTSSSTTGRRTRPARTSISTRRPRSASIVRTSRRASRSARGFWTASGPRCRSSAAPATCSPTSCATRSWASRSRPAIWTPRPTPSCASPATTPCGGPRGTISPPSRTATPGARRSRRSSPGSRGRRAAVPRWISTPSCGTSAPTRRRGRSRARVPLPLRKHVLGPAKRRLQRAAMRFGDS